MAPWGPGRPDTPAGVSRAPGSLTPGLPLVLLRLVHRVFGGGGRGDTTAPQSMKGVFHHSPPLPAATGSGTRSIRPGGARHP